MSGRQILCVCLLVLALALPTGGKGTGNRKNRPRHVTANVINSTTVNIRWQPPKHVSASCPLKQYLIRLKTDETLRARRWRVEGGTRSLTLRDLQEGTAYYIRLVADTCRGKSAPTRWLKVITHQQKSGAERAMEDQAVRNLTENRAPAEPTAVRTRTSSESVMLTWQPPGGNVIVRGYMVGYGEGVPDVNWQYVDFKARNLTIKNLKPATQYVISIRAFNNFGKGPVMYDLIYTRDRSGEGIDGPTTGPLSPPSNLRAKVLSPTTAWLQWGDPTLGRDQQINDNRYYNVHYQALPSGKTLSVIVKALHVVLYDLTPGTPYTFKVRTVNNALSSPFSFSIHNKTFDAEPGSPPRSVNVQSENNESNSVVIRWRAPRQPNGDITGYLISWGWQSGPEDVRWERYAVGGDTQHLNLQNLVPQRTYLFHVQARNSQGYSPPSQNITYRVPDPNAPRRPIILLPTTEFPRSSPTDTNRDHRDRGEKRTPTEIPDAEEGTDDDNTSGRADDSPVTPAALRSGGSLQAVALNGALRGPDLEFSAIVRHSVSAAVSWEWPCGEDNHDILSYVLQYYKAGSDASISASQVTSDTNLVLLQDLETDVLYLYRVRAVYTDDTESEWSSEGQLDTRRHIG